MPGRVPIKPSLLVGLPPSSPTPRTGPRNIPDRYIKLDEDWRIVSVYARDGVDWLSPITNAHRGLPVLQLLHPDSIPNWKFALMWAQHLDGKRGLPISYSVERRGLRHLRLATFRRLANGGYSVAIDEVATVPVE